MTDARDRHGHRRDEALTGLVGRDGVVADGRSRDRDLEPGGARRADRGGDRRAGRRGVVGIGIGVASLIDQRTGEAVSSVNVPIQGLRLRDRVRERFDLPTGIENDANAAALAEHAFGAGRGTRHMVLLTLGTGIGGGLVLNGQLYRGAYGAAAELGHITIDLDGPKCQGACPGFGHLEVLASGTAAGELARAIAEERRRRSGPGGRRGPRDRRAGGRRAGAPR